MISGLSALKNYRKVKRAAQEQEDINTQIDNIIYNMGVTKDFKTRVTSKVAKKLLLEDVIITHGRFLRAKAKNIGCGVYEITAEEI